MEQFRHRVAVGLSRQSRAKRIADGLQPPQPFTGRAVRPAEIAGLSVTPGALLCRLEGLLWRRWWPGKQITAGEFQRGKNRIERTARKAMEQDTAIVPRPDAKAGRAVMVRWATRLPTSLTRSARRHQSGEGFDRHGWGFNLGRVFSAITRRTSAMGTKRRRPIFTEATAPE
jgi:hypothetical protein